jgi:hypothetical protein
LGKLSLETDDREILKSKREEIMKGVEGVKKQMAGDDPKTYDAEVIKSMFKKLQEVPKRPINAEDIRGYEELQGALWFIDEVTDAFSEPDDAIFDANFGPDFGGKTRNELRKALNDAFPDIRLGTLLYNMKNPGTDSLLQAVANRSGIDNEEQLVAMFQNIHEKLRVMWPEIEEEILYRQLNARS